VEIYAISDMHGSLPSIPDCDLLIVAGDICPDFPNKFQKYEWFDNGSVKQLEWLANSYRPWLEDLSERGIEVIGIAGNHDFVFERMAPDVEELQLPWTYLLDEGVIWRGLSIWGTPWVPGLRRWAFYASETALYARTQGIPRDLDILISHGPPYGTADEVLPKFGGTHVGDEALAFELRVDLRPKVIVTGHIHEQYGRHTTPTGVTLYNVSHMDDNYDPNNLRPATRLSEFELFEDRLARLMEEHSEVLKRLGE
jgi:Icc-related predicted phosphoesterase